MVYSGGIYDNVHLSPPHTPVAPAAGEAAAAAGRFRTLFPITPHYLLLRQKRIPYYMMWIRA